MTSTVANHDLDVSSYLIRAGLPTPAATAAATVPPRPSFVDFQRPPAQIGSVCSFDGSFGRRGIGHLDKCKATRAPSIAVPDNVNAIHFAIRCE